MFYKCSDNFTHLPFTKDFLLPPKLLLRNNSKYLTLNKLSGKSL